MKAEDLLKAIGEADEELLERSEQSGRKEPVQQRKQPDRKAYLRSFVCMRRAASVRILGLAAACVLFLAAGVYVGQNVFGNGRAGSGSSSAGNGGAAAEGDLEAGMPEMAMEGEFSSGHEEMAEGGNYFDADGGIQAGETIDGPDEGADENVTDESITDENPADGSSGNMKESTDGSGGSDQHKRDIFILTSRWIAVPHWLYIAVFPVSILMLILSGRQLVRGIKQRMEGTNEEKTDGKQADKRKLHIVLAAACMIIGLVLLLLVLTGRIISASMQGGIVEPVNGLKWGSQDEMRAAKPVIYLYPAETMDVEVRLDYAGELNCTWPAYEEGWQVTASPDGRIINKADGREYSYLFWEGTDHNDYDMSKGFVVKGEDTAEFLQEKLALLGLLPKEYNEFIVYWLPRLVENPYNLITFQAEAYTDAARLTILPEPDSILRIFMVYQPLEEPVSVEEPQLTGFERKGFTVVEWGGALKNH